MAVRLRCGEGDDQVPRVSVINHGQDWTYSWLIMSQFSYFILRNNSFIIKTDRLLWWLSVKSIIILRSEETPGKRRLNHKFRKNYICKIWPFVCWVDFIGAA